LSKITVYPGKPTVIQDLVTVSEIHKGNKQSHFRNINAETSIPFQEMVFFDDNKSNCVSVAKLGVTCYYVPTKGVTASAWSLMQETFPSPGKVINCE
jgi:predicted enzyme involved in methoxymalonyl-ACP biosynthesis